jgi:hypothetical protein
MKSICLAAAVCAGIAGCDAHHHEHGGNCSHSRTHGHAKGDHGGCSRPASGHARCAEAGHAHGSGDEHRHHGAIRVPSALQKTMGLKTVRAEKRCVSAALTLAGRYELSPDARLTVSTPIGGRLSLEVKPLERVKKGDVLFRVSSPELVSREREIAVLQRRLAVYHEIKTANAALENELAVKREERRSLLAGAEEKDGVVTVRAAADGIVESYLAENGAWLGTGDAAVGIVRPGALRFKALAASSDASRLKGAVKAEVGGRTGELRLGIGGDSGLVPVYVVFGDETGAVAGERAVANIVVGEAAGLQVAVPSKCIVTVGLQPTLFVRDGHDPELFVPLPVSPLASAGGWTAVDGPIAPGAEIVSDGAYELKTAASAGKSGPAGHFHADGVFHEGEH